jgi:3-oxoacyl-[acyl-carrier protein] reductase
MKTALKVAIISGSSKGIGLSLANKFLKKNYKVVINSRNFKNLNTIHKKLKKKFPNRVLMVCGDISKTSTLKNIEKSVLTKWNRIDVLIANAGDISNKNKSWLINKNFITSKKFVDYFYKYLIKTEGSIVFISSIAALIKNNAPIGYSISKKLINNYGKKLSLKLAKYKVNVNIVAPGNIYFKNGNWFNKLKNDPKKITKYIKDNVPMNMFGSVSDIANLCFFLSSNESNFITGQIIAVDGGQSIRWLI